MKLERHERVPIDVAEIRAMGALSRSPTHASVVANHIWPGHQMKPQGAGAAASRVLKRLEKQGRVRWIYTDSGWGWVCAP